MPYVIGTILYWCWHMGKVFCKYNSSITANGHSASHEIPCLLWNLKIHFCVHNSLPLVPILSQMNSVHNFLIYFPKIHSNIILPSTTWSSTWSLQLRFYHESFGAFLISLMRSAYSAHFFLLDVVTLITYGEAYKFLWQKKTIKILTVQH